MFRFGTDVEVVGDDRPRQLIFLFTVVTNQFFITNHDVIWKRLSLVSFEQFFTCEKNPFRRPLTLTHTESNFLTFRLLPSSLNIY